VGGKGGIVHGDCTASVFQDVRMDPTTSPLTTDLYQLTMLNAYFARGMRECAVFELFVRRLPPNRSFLVAAGLEQALDFLEGLSFSAEELKWVRSNRLFRARFADELARLRFTGDVDAMPEGTVFFAQEPVLRVIAPLPEAQLVETRLINLVQFETMIASKAARTVIAAPDRLLVDFGLRRSHGAEAGLLAARAAYLAGFAGTATVLAGVRFGIPLFGTMAHSFIQAHDSESQAFSDFASLYPHGTTLLIDTYDTERAARKTVDLVKRGLHVGAVRLDSGDLAALSRTVRAIFDENGLEHVKIFASGNLDEYRVRDMVAAGAPIDAFGVGTSLVTSADAPSLDAVYKLQEYAGKPRRKRSLSKATWPGRKQVFRTYDAHGAMREDVLALQSERLAGDALLVPVMRQGRRVGARESLDAVRRRTASKLAKLPISLRAIDGTAPYPVRVSESLEALAREADTLLTDDGLS
jgi:nicotinate phosphoribosyltransferase